MKVLIVNPILYTNENRNIKKVNTIKDTMIYDLCLAFKKRGATLRLLHPIYIAKRERELSFKYYLDEDKAYKTFSAAHSPLLPGG